MVVACSTVALKLGRYDVCAKLGEGGMADIFVARLRGVEGFERPIAIKMLKEHWAGNPELVRMFIDEARLASGLSHPNVVQVYELGREDGKLFLAMELLFGRSLAEIWEECRARGIRLRGDVVAWIGARSRSAPSRARAAHDGRHPAERRSS